MKYKIEVTQEDKDNGIPRNCSWCPIALAAKRVFPQATCIDISAEDMFVYLDVIPGLAFSLPQEASDFVADFDNGFDSAKPFSFIVEEIGT